MSGKGSKVEVIPQRLPIARLVVGSSILEVCIRLYRGAENMEAFKEWDCIGKQK